MTKQNYLKVGKLIKCGHCYPEFQVLENCDCVCHKKPMTKIKQITPNEITIRRLSEQNLLDKLYITFFKKARPMKNREYGLEINEIMEILKKYIPKKDL